jgi:hypothetical protein
VNNFFLKYGFYICAPKRQSGVTVMISSSEDLNTTFPINPMVLSMPSLEILFALKVKLITVTLKNVTVYRPQ